MIVSLKKKKEKNDSLLKTNTEFVLFSLPTPGEVVEKKSPDTQNMSSQALSTDVLGGLQVTCWENIFLYYLSMSSYLSSQTLCISKLGHYT